MAESNGEYLVSPESGRTVIIPTENAAAAKADGFVPASEQQIAEFNARVEAKRSPVASTLKTAALGAAELLAPTSITRTIMDVGAQPEALVSGLAERFLPEPISKGFRAAQTFAELRGPTPEQAGLRAAADILAPVTPTGALLATGLQTREQIEAEREQAGLTGQVLSLAGAVLGPAALARTALSGAAKGATALALEERAAEAAARAARLTSESAPGAAVAVKASEEAAKKLATAVDTAAARRALLAKVPGGEKIAQGVERALKLPDEANALKLVSEAAGRPVSQAAERSVAALIEKTPALSKAPQIVKDLVAKSVAAGAGASADLALLSLGQTNQEAILGDHKITAERALANMEAGAIEGFKFGLVLGGVPTALGGAIDVTGKAVRALDSTFNRYYPRLASMITGADVQSVEALRRARGEIANVGELIEQDLAARKPLPPEPAPFEPGVEPAPFVPEQPAMVGVEGLGMVRATKAPGIGEMAPLEPLPRPEKPVPATMMEYKAPPLTPVETERAAQELLRDLRAVDEGSQKLMYEFNKTIRPEEQVRLFENWHRWQQDRVVSEATKALQGRIATPAEQKAFSQAKAAIDDLVYDEGMRLSNYIRGVVGGTLKQFPDAMPTSTLKRMSELANKLERVSRKEVPVTKTYDTINSVKRQLFDLAPVFEEGEVVSQLEAKARQAARKAGLELITATEKEAIWGPNAVRQAKVNDARTRLTLANKNVKRLLGRKEDIGIDASRREFASNKISNFVKDPTSVSNADKLDAVLEWRSSVENFEREARESAKGYRGETSLEEFGDSLGRLAKSYTEVENTAIRKIDFEFAKQEAKRLRAEVDDFNAQLKAENAARKAEFDRVSAEIDAAENARLQARKDLETRVEQMEGERKARAQVELERLRANNKVAEQEAKARLDAFRAREKAAEAEANARRVEFDKVLKQRKAEVAEQVDLLRKNSKYSDVPGMILLYEAVTHPALIPAAVAKNPILTYKVLDKLERAAKATDAKAKAIVDYISTRDRKVLAALEPAVMPKTPKQEREQYEERVKNLRKIVDDTNELSQHIDRGVQEVNDQAPNVADHARTVQTNALLSVAKAIPQPPPNLPPYQRATWQPTDAQMRKFNRTYDAVAKPTSVMRNMALGTATQAEIDMVNSVYGSLMDDLRTRVIDRLKKEPNIPATERAKLSKLMGLDIDGAPALGMTAQSVYGTQTPQQQPQLKSFQGKALNVAGRAEYLGKARSEVQPSGVEQRIQARR